LDLRLAVETEKTQSQENAQKRGAYPSRLHAVLGALWELPRPYNLLSDYLKTSKIGVI
jgi:hypothetical protein